MLPLIAFDLGVLFGAAAVALDGILRPGTGRRRRRRGDPPWDGPHVICSCHGYDLTRMRDVDVLALHPVRVPSAFAEAADVDPAGFVRWAPLHGAVPLHDADPDAIRDHHRRAIREENAETLEALARGELPAAFRTPTRDTTPPTGRIGT